MQPLPSPQERTGDAEVFRVHPLAQDYSEDMWPNYKGVFVRRPPEWDSGDEAVPELEAVTGRWGLISSKRQGPEPKLSTFNARSETAQKSFTFGNAWRKGQHCVIPAEAKSASILATGRPRVFTTLTWSARRRVCPWATPSRMRSALTEWSLIMSGKQITYEGLHFPPATSPKTPRNRTAVPWFRSELKLWR